MLVTIIIRTYCGREALLARALESVKEQHGVDDIETLVIVDGDDDIDTSNIDIDQHRNLRIIRLGKQLGRSYAANIGLDNAKGEYINFLDDDDWLEKDHARTLADRLSSSPRAVAAYSAAWQLEATIDKKNPDASLYGQRTKFFYGRASSLDLIDINLFPIQAVMFRRSIVDSGIRFPTTLDALEDWLFWQKALLGEPIVSVNAITSTFLVPLDPTDIAKRVREHEAALKAFYAEQKAIRIPLTTLAEASSFRRRPGRLAYGDPSNFHSTLKALLLERRAELSRNRTTLSQSIEYHVLTGARAIWVGPGRTTAKQLSKFRHRARIGAAKKKARGNSDVRDIILTHRFFERQPSIENIRDTDVIYTVCNWRYIDKALALADSCKKYMPKFQFHLLLVDELNEESVKLINQKGSIDKIFMASDLPVFTDGWVFEHNVVELSTAVKPFYLNHLLGEGASRVIYLDPDTLLLDPLNSVLSAIDRQDVALTPHLFRPAATDDSIANFEVSALAHGIFNLGFFACRNSQNARRVAVYWQERCRKYCFGDVPRGLFTDQKWFDHVPVFFPGVEILAYPGVNAAIWNMEGRGFTQTKGRYFVDRQPLEMFHFSGWDKGTPAHFAKSLINGRAGRALLSEYKGQVDRNKEFVPRRPWIYDLYADGSPVTQAQRTCYRRHKDLQIAFPKPFSVGPQTYHDWVHSEGATAIEEQYDESVWVRRHF